MDSEAWRAGVCLCASLWGERDGTDAMRHLPAHTRQALKRQAEADDDRRRTEQLRSLVERVRPPLPAEPAVSPRARTLLAAQVAPETGKRWLAGGPPPRPGYATPSGLLTALRRWAAAR